MPKTHTSYRIALLPRGAVKPRETDAGARRRDACRLAARLLTTEADGSRATVYERKRWSRDQPVAIYEAVRDGGRVKGRDL